MNVRRTTTIQVTSYRVVGAGWMYPLGELSGHTPDRKETDIKGTACWPSRDSLNE